MTPCFFSFPNMEKDLRSKEDQRTVINWWFLAASSSNACKTDHLDKIFPWCRDTSMFMCSWRTWEQSVRRGRPETLQCSEKYVQTYYTWLLCIISILHSATVLVLVKHVFWDLNLDIIVIWLGSHCYLYFRRILIPSSSQYLYNSKKKKKKKWQG